MGTREIQKPLTVFLLTMINVATIGSIKNWPVTAEYGFSSIFYMVLASLVFFIPSALVAAELSSTFPKLGGVFSWVKEAFGQRFGFLAAWLLWFQNIVWYPTILSFIAATFAYIFDPTLMNNQIYTFCFILILFWGVTLLNMKGMRVSGWISSLGMIFGTLIPGLFIIILGLIWILTDRPAQIDLSVKSLIPDMSAPSNLVLFTGVMLSLAGIEMSAVHARDVKNPKKDYPRAIFFSTLIILALSIPGILSIAVVVPKKEISLVAGPMQAITVFLNEYHLAFLVPIMGCLIAIGALASMSTWIAGPTKGLLAAAREGELPPRFRKINRHQMPITLLIIQAIIVSCLSFMFILFPGFNQAFWMLTAILSILYLLMYLLFFSAALVLRYKKKQSERPFKVPGGNYGIWIVCVLGFLSALFAIVIGIFPPEQIPFANKTLYVCLLLGGVILFSLGPTIILFFKKPAWNIRLEHEKDHP